MLALGETGGLFQLNGSGMTRYLKDLRPTTIHDINAMVALYRPGPMESIPEYINRKHNPSLVRYLDPRLKSILSESYGVMTYQDDVMLTAIELAGYSWLEADKLRKAMGKKIPAEMEAQKEKLIKGLIKNGMTKKKADELWKLIEPFAAYGFNKCLTGDTKIVDVKTGKILTVGDIYKSRKKVSLLSIKNDLSFEKSGISAVAENGIKDVFELTTKTGRRIRATGNHPFLTIFGWQNLEKLKEGDRVAIARTLENAVGQDNESQKAAVLGYLLSEGNFCHPHGVYFYSTQKAEVDDFIRVAACFENCKFTLDYNKKTTAVYCGQKDPQVGNLLYNWITELGLGYKKATMKFVPEPVFGWSRKSLSVFLGKMWQGDGCISIKNQQVYYATSSEKMAEQVAHLLLRLGIMSTVHTKKFKYRGSYKVGYTIVVCHRENLKRFSGTVGFSMIGRKKEEIFKLVEMLEKVPEIAARGTKDTIPHQILKIIRA
jgi:DNA polymerase-3 subunit alpha